MLWCNAKMNIYQWHICSSHSYNCWMCPNIFIDYTCIKHWTHSKYLNWLQLTCIQKWLYSNWGLNLTYSQKSRTLNMYNFHLRRWRYVPRSIPGPSDWQPLPHQLQDVLSICSHWGGTWQSIHPQYSSGYDQSHGEEETVVVLTMLGREYILSRNVLQGKWIIIMW